MFGKMPERLSESIDCYVNNCDIVNQSVRPFNLCLSQDFRDGHYSSNRQFPEMLCPITNLPFSKVL